MMKTKVTFILSADIVADATEGLLLGEFNNWDKDKGFSLKKQKDGSLKATLPLEAGTYQYRYLLNDGRWVNDESADQYVPSHAFQVENCLITVPLQDETVETKQKAADKKDDLTKIEGIGKKIAELLIAENIISFTDLSKSTAKKLKSILDAAGSKFKMHDPATWPKQAKLAAAGKWDDLKTLQEKLKGGK